MPEKRKNKISDSLFYLFVMLLIVIPLVGYYTYKQVFGNTQIATTVATNDDLNDGLIGHWTLDGGDMDWASTTAEALDTSGSGYNGDAISITSSAAVAGKIGQALDFTGQGKYISVSSMSSSVFMNNPFTWSAWVKGTTTYATNNNMPSIGYGSTAWPRLGFKESNGWVFSMYKDGTNHIEVSCGSSGTSTWRFLLVTATPGGNVSCYQDNQLIASNSYVADVSVTGAFGIGRAGVTSSGWGEDFRGPMDDIRVYDRVLSATERQRLYDLGKTTHIATTINTNTDLENGLVGHWTFDGKDMDWSSTTAEVLDTSGNSNNGNVTNFGQEGAVGGKLGQALSFDGSNDFVQLPGSNVFIPSTDSPTTFSMWFNASSIGSGSLANRMLDLYKTTTGSAVIVSVGSNNQLQFYDGAVAHNSATVSTGIWYLATLVFNGADYQMYINGTAVGSPVTATLTAGHTTNATLGDYLTPANFFSGKLDDVRIYNRALSAGEIQRLYDLGKTTHIATTINTNTDLNSGLVGYWTFDGPDMNWSSTTAEALDTSGNSNNGNIVNFGSESAISGKSGQAFELDGVNDYIDVSSSLVNTLAGLSAFSVSLWAKADTNQTNPVALSIRQNDGVSATLFLIYPFDTNGGNGLRVWFNSTSIINENGVDRADGKWHHFVFVARSATDHEAYVDNVSVGTDTTSKTLPDPLTGVNIGRWYGTTQMFNGGIDDVRIYNRALSTAEIKRLYELGR